MRILTGLWLYGSELDRVRLRSSPATECAMHVSPRVRVNKRCSHHAHSRSYDTSPAQLLHEQHPTGAQYAEYLCKAEDS